VVDVSKTVFERFFQRYPHIQDEGRSIGVENIYAAMDEK